jgi:hypothetical protein
MKTNLRNNLFAVFLPLLTAGCNNAVDEEELCTPKAVEFYASIADVDMDTRASGVWDYPLYNICVSAIGDDTYQNQVYKTKKGMVTATFTPDEDASPYYFKNVNDVRTFVAFAPSSLSGYHNTTDNTLTVVTDSDIIWAVAKDVSYTNPVANFNFVHCMAQLNITVELDENSLGKGATATQEISNLIPRGSLSLLDGTLTPYNYTKHYPFDSGKTFTVLPQPEGLKVTVFVGNTAYQTTLPELKAGTSYQFTLTVKNDGLSLKSTIKNWETVEDSVTAEKVLGADSSGD